MASDWSEHIWRSGSRVFRSQFCIKEASLCNSGTWNKFDRSPNPVSSCCTSSCPLKTYGCQGCPGKDTGSCKIRVTPQRGGGGGGGLCLRGVKLVLLASRKTQLQMSVYMNLAWISSLIFSQLCSWVADLDPITMWTDVKWGDMLLIHPSIVYRYQLSTEGRGGGVELELIAAGTGREAGLVPSLSQGYHY